MTDDLRECPPTLGGTEIARIDQPKPAIDADRELIKAIAMDIGKAVVHHIETMYPAMFEAVAGTAKLSVRNCVHNEIMAALEVNDADAIRGRLARRKKHRREIKAAYKRARQP